MNDFYNFPTLVEELTSNVANNLDIHDIHGAYIKDVLVEYMLDQPTDCGKNLRANLYDLQCLSHAVGASIEFSMRSIVHQVAHQALRDSQEVTL